MRTPLFVAAVLAASTLTPAVAGQSPFAGRWNMTGVAPDTERVYWLEVKEDAGALSGMFLNRGGSPVALQTVKVENGELIFQMRGQGNRPGLEFRGRLDGQTLKGTVPDGARTIQWVGVRPPVWPASNANGAHAYGAPVELFDGTSLDAWGVQHATRPIGWSIEDRTMTNGRGANNLVSKATFRDFRLRAEYRTPANANSGIYLRGRYELQVLGDHGQPPGVHSHMSIYGWTAPSVNASLAPDEWQTMEAVLVGNCVTVTLNGQRVHDNATIQAITGGALDANETAPGPIMIQGDHSKVWYRRVTVTPITTPGR